MSWKTVALTLGSIALVLVAFEWLFPRGQAGEGSYVVELRGLEQEGVHLAQALAFCTTVRDRRCEPMQQISCNAQSCRYRADGWIVDALEIRIALSDGVAWASRDDCHLNQPCILTAEHGGGGEIEAWVGRWDSRL